MIIPMVVNMHLSRQRLVQFEACLEEWPRETIQQSGRAL